MYNIPCIPWIPYLSYISNIPNLPDMSIRDDDQPSLLDYARFHGLAADHLQQNILTFISSDALRSDEDAILSDFRLPDVAEIPAEPKFQLNSKAISLLASSIRPPPPPKLTNDPSDHHKVKNLKMELPLLRTDHDTDMKKLLHRMPVKLPAWNLVPIEVDEESGEGLAWPQEIVGLAAVWDRRAAKEKLQTTREVLKALQDTLRSVYTAQTQEEIIAKGSIFTRVRCLNSLLTSILKFNSVYY